MTQLTQLQALVSCLCIIILISLIQPLHAQNYNTTLANIIAQEQQASDDEGDSFHEEPPHWRAHLQSM